MLNAFIKFLYVVGPIVALGFVVNEDPEQLPEMLLLFGFFILYAGRAL